MWPCLFVQAANLYTEAPFAIRLHILHYSSESTNRGSDNKIQRNVKELFKGIGVRWLANVCYVYDIPRNVWWKSKLNIDCCYICDFYKLSHANKVKHRKEDNWFVYKGVNIWLTQSTNVMWITYTTLWREAKKSEEKRRKAKRSEMKISHNSSVIYSKRLVVSSLNSDPDLSPLQARWINALMYKIWYRPEGWQQNFVILTQLIWSGNQGSQTSFEGWDRKR